MGRRSIITLLMVSAMVLLMAAFGVAACNTAEISTSGGGSTGSGELTDPNAVFQSLRDGAATLESAAYVADIEVTGVSDPAVTDDPTAQLAENLKVHAEGAFAKDGMAAQGAFEISVGGQTINAELKANESGVYIGLMGQWYQVPPEQTEEFKQYATMSPADIFGKLGVNLDELSSERTMVGVETIDGAECYHIVGKPDPAQVAAQLVDTLNAPEIKDKAAEAASGLSVDPAEAEKLKDVVKEISVDYWVDVETGWVRKADAVIKLEKAPDDTETGLQSAEVKVALTLSKFNEPVTVETPASPLPFDQLGEALLGGGMGEI